jgi:selenoprotein W-related protein
LTEEVLGDREVEAYVRSWNLLPATGGVYEVTVNGEVVFSKKEIGRHAEPGEVKAAIVDRLESIKSGAN